MNLNNGQQPLHNRLKAIKTLKQTQEQFKKLQSAVDFFTCVCRKLDLHWQNKHLPCGSKNVLMASSLSTNYHMETLLSITMVSLYTHLYI